MKLKHVFFSSLLLSTAFVGCTNDEFAENIAADTTEAIALGEGFTIDIANADADAETRAEFLGGYSTGYNPVWKAGDIVGAAWFHQVTKIDEKNLVANCQEMSPARYLFSNHQFALKSGAGTNKGEFECNTNAFAGAYILYYPWTDFSMTNGEIPVKLASYEMDCTSGKELDAVNKNMFSYGVGKLVPGGKQTQDLAMHQIPVLYMLNFEAKDQKFLGLLDKMTIEMVVVEAKKGGSSVLRTTGKITAPNETACPINKDSYNKNELPEAKYVGVGETDHISIDLLNSDNAAYKITSLNKRTEKPFIFSALPFSEAADEITFKIVCTDGNGTYVFAKTYKADGNKEIVDIINNGSGNSKKGAADEGGIVKGSITIDVLEEDDVVYTAEQFKEKWAAAMAAEANSDALTIKLGHNIDLSEEDLVFNQANNQTVIIKDECDEHYLTVKNLTLTGEGTLKVEAPLNVEETLKSDAYTEIKATEGQAVLKAKTIIAEGTAAYKVESAELLDIAASGEVTLSGREAGSTIERVKVRKTGTKWGTLAVSNFTITDLENEGALTVDEEVNVKEGGTITNSNRVALKGDFTNYGTFNHEGVMSFTAKNKFTNAEGAELNINAALTNATVIENSAAKNGKPAGVINVAKNVTWTVGAAGALVNAGTINVAGTLTENKNGSAGITTASDAKGTRIYVKEGGKLDVQDKTKVFTSKEANNLIVVEKGATIADDNGGHNYVAYEMASNKDERPKLSTANQGVINAVIIKGNVSINGTIVNSNLHIVVDSECTVTMTEDITAASMNVFQDATLTGNDRNNKRTLTAAVNVADGKILTVKKDFAEIASGSTKAGNVVEL